MPARTATDALLELKARVGMFDVKDFDVELTLPAALAGLVPQFQAAAEAGDADEALRLARDVAQAASVLAAVRADLDRKAREANGACAECDRTLSDHPWYTRYRPYCGEGCRDAAKARKKAAATAERLTREREQVLARLERREDIRERNAVRKIVAEARREYNAERPRKRYTGPARPGYVYRLYDASGALLYVGKTYNVTTRLLASPTSHSATKKWFRMVALVKIAAYHTEAAALEAEAWAIHREAPIHNVVAPARKQRRAPRPIAVYEGAL